MYFGRTDLICPECGAPLTLKRSRFGYFYGCSKYNETGCRGSVGAHRSGEPLGFPVDQETRSLRVRAHALFDQLWQGTGIMSRAEAYRWLQETMDLEAEQAHIGRMERLGLRRLIEILETEGEDYGIDLKVGL